MQKAVEYCLKSQAVSALAHKERDPKVREALVSDARAWFLLAEIELALEDRDEPQVSTH
jgi:hypothetical protein